jgi:hypothetical protein
LGTLLEKTLQVKMPGARGFARFLNRKQLAEYLRCQLFLGKSSSLYRGCRKKLMLSKTSWPKT